MKAPVENKEIIIEPSTSPGGKNMFNQISMEQPVVDEIMPGEQSSKPKRKKKGSKSPALEVKPDLHVPYVKQGIENQSLRMSVRSKLRRREGHQELPQLSFQQIKAIKVSWDTVVSYGLREAADVLYDYLFANMPQFKSMFTLDDNRYTKGVLTMEAFGKVVGMLSQFDRVVPHLKKLGDIHMKRGVHKDHYELFEKSFNQTIAHILRKSYTAEVDTAFKTMFKMCKLAMLGEHIQDEQVCSLCQKTRPIFIVDDDSEILRMPEKFMPPFLISLKMDFLARKQYFKLLKINSKFISMCECPRQLQHTYCATAQLLRTRRIYCKCCNGYYRLQLSKEELISQETLRTLIQLVFLYVILQLAIIGIGYLDNKMKLQYIEENHLDRVELGVPLETTGINVTLSLSLLIIWLYCVSLNLRNCINKDQRILGAEVLDIFKYENEVSRHQSKQNLSLALKQTSMSLIRDNYFDQYWYDQRESKYVQGLKGEGGSQFNSLGLPENKT